MRWFRRGCDMLDFSSADILSRSLLQQHRRERPGALRMPHDGVYNEGAAIKRV